MSAHEIARALPIWQGKVEPVPLDGGITNTSFVVQDGPRRVVVRIGADIPLHQVMRFNELAASRAAEAAGVSPPVRYHAPGVLVIDWVEGQTLTPERVRDATMLDRVAALLARAHAEVGQHLRGPALAFWVFHVIRDYAATLRDGGSRHGTALPALLAAAARLEVALGPVDLVFAHNDLLAGNLIDDGARLWLIDWDYAGWNSPLFDLGGLAANNGLSQAQEIRMLEQYFDRPASDDLLRRFRAMKCAAALREALWSMVSELHSALPVDYAAYTETTLATYRAALDDFTQS